MSASPAAADHPFLGAAGDALANAGLDEARRLGVGVEIYLAASRSTQVRVQEGKVESFTVADSRGAGVRVFRDGRIGVASTEVMEPEALRQAVAEAAAITAWLEPMPGQDLPRVEGSLPYLDLASPSLRQVSVEARISRVLELDALAREADPRVKTVVGASWGDVAAHVRLCSSAGLQRSWSMDTAWAAVSPLVAEGTQTKNGRKVVAAREFSAFVPGQMAREAVEDGLLQLGASEVPSGRYPVVFTAEAWADMLGVFAGLFSAKAAEEGKSLLRGREGERLAASCLTIVDDPLLREGMAARPCDDEGVPSRPHDLIRDGHLGGLLHNVATAARAGGRSTGHAARASYKGGLGVGTSNLVVAAGRESEAGLRAGASVIEVRDVTGLHAGANAISGDFSLQAHGLWHREGRAPVPVHLFTVSGNFLDLLAQVEALGQQIHVLPSGVLTPEVRVGGLSIAGT
ncbi:MAG: TldD/PmbA family protein [Candidatus Sericytochromatia bacterium]|nr:TldD/PmbA family protein [Candidatus Tanganyikabacteria bacterium]